MTMTEKEIKESPEVTDEQKEREVPTETVTKKRRRRPKKTESELGKTEAKPQSQETAWVLCQNKKIGIMTCCVMQAAFSDENELTTQYPTLELDNEGNYVDWDGRYGLVATQVPFTPSSPT